MKKLIATYFLVLLIATGINAQEKNESAVTNAIEKLRQAMISGNQSDLESIVMDKLSYGHSGGLVEDKKEFVKNIASGKSDFVTIDLSEQTISISDKTAIVRHILKAKTNDGDKPGEVHLRILLVWQKHSGEWKLLARQAVKVI